MRVEIYGDANRKTVSGPTVQFTADDAAPVTDLKAQITPSIAGRSSVTITANGQNTSVSLTKPVYGGAVDVTTGVVTETHGGGAYNPTEVPADLSSKIVSATTVKSASGSVASFNCTLGEYPMSALTATINPVQDLHGYDNPWPGGGGKNLLNSDLIAAAYKSTLVWSGDVATVTATGASYGGTTMSGSLVLIAGQTYTLSAHMKVLSDDSNFYPRLSFRRRSNNNVLASTARISGTEADIHVTYTPAEGVEVYVSFVITGGTAANAKIQFSHVQLELGSTASNYEPYENICPITGWTGATIHVSPTTSGGTTYSVTFPTAAETVYGGTLDVANGTLTVTMIGMDLGSYDWRQYSFSGQKRFVWSIPTSVSGKGVDDTPVISDIYQSGDPTASVVSTPNYSIRGRSSDYPQIIIRDDSLIDDSLSDGAINPAVRQAVSGHMAVWHLATPITYTLTPQEIATILGQNNVWADTGDVTVSYRDGLLSNVSGIMTNSTALTAGENITYTLSQERTFQIPGTVIRTVVGNNVMSASTGNISVTWSSHWFDITPWIAYQGLTFSRNDVDSPDAGRDMSGYMHRGRVGVKEKMNITTVQLTRAQSSTLQTLLYPETIQVRVTPYPRTNTSHTMSMYTNNVKTTYVIHRENGEDLQSLTFPLIEN